MGKFFSSDSEEEDEDESDEEDEITNETSSSSKNNNNSNLYSDISLDRSASLNDLSSSSPKKVKKDEIKSEVKN